MENDEFRMMNERIMHSSFILPHSNRLLDIRDLNDTFLRSLLRRSAALELSLEPKQREVAGGVIVSRGSEQVL
jgi:hypothetical protein